ncbi:MAG TPA: hypothetical protein DEQ87_20030, partial [Algoriphagus sp.]|nr:hypothetical protein [Algoriphagus sp.]
NLGELCQKEVKNPHYNQIEPPRHTITVDYHQFVNDLKKQLPKEYLSKKPILNKKETVNNEVE